MNKRDTMYGEVYSTNLQAMITSEFHIFRDTCIHNFQLVYLKVTMLLNMSEDMYILYK